MNKVSKEDLVYSLSKKVGVSQSCVKQVIDTYVDRLKNQLNEGKTIKFLNLCYLVNNNNGKPDYNETLAYTSNIIGQETRLGKHLVYRILHSYEEMIIEDLKKFYCCGVRGLVKFRYIEYERGIYKLRVNKGSNLGSHIKVVTINSFKRRVELDDWKNT